MSMNHCIASSSMVMHDQKLRKGAVHNREIVTVDVSGSS